MKSAFRQWIGDRHNQQPLSVAARAEGEEHCVHCTEESLRGGLPIMTALPGQLGMAVLVPGSPPWSAQLLACCNQTLREKQPWGDYFKSVAEL